MDEEELLITKRKQSYITKIFGDGYSSKKPKIKESTATIASRKLMVATAESWKTSTLTKHGAADQEC